MTTRLTAVLIASSMLLTQSPAFAQPTTTTAPAEKAPAEKPTGKGAASVTKVRGTVAAVDKDAGTVTLKGPKGRTVTIEVKDKQKLDMIKVGDPVVAAYVEAVAFRVQKVARDAAQMIEPHRVARRSDHRLSSERGAIVLRNNHAYRCRQCRGRRVCSRTQRGRRASRRRTRLSPHHLPLLMRRPAPRPVRWAPW